MSALAMVQAWMAASAIARPAGYAAMFEMPVIEELKRNFGPSSSLGCVRSWGSYP